MEVPKGGRRYDNDKKKINTWVEDMEEPYIWSKGERRNLQKKEEGRINREAIGREGGKRTK